MDSATLRAWWSHRQGLDGRFAELPPESVLAKTGWCRSVGGANPYLALHARTGASRAQTDEALANCRIHELPSARGCTYVVPEVHFALALTVGQGFGDDSNLNTAVKHLGVTLDEIERLGELVCNALVDGPKDPKALRNELGDKVRSFGDEGKKRGVTSDLPLALGRLQGRGRIRRVPVNGRLDNQRYAYSLWSPNPLESRPIDRDEAFRQLARLYFSWIGPATIKEFQWLSGLGVKASQEAIAGLPLVEVEGRRLLLDEDVAEFESFQASAAPSYVLVGSIDNITHLRLGLQDAIADEDKHRAIPGEKSLLNLTGLTELVSHGIYDRGRLIGVWDFDPESQSVITQLWIEKDEALQNAIDRTERFVREDLGDARTFSLDSPESRKQRLALLRD